MKALFKEARVELELQAVNHFKRSPAYHAMMLRELHQGFITTRHFFRKRDRTTLIALYKWDMSIERHKEDVLEVVKGQRVQCDKVGIFGEDPNAGLMPSSDYSQYIVDEPDDIVWPTFDDLLIEYEDDPTGTSQPDSRDPIIQSKERPSTPP
ncbi:hypothetical protein LWI29_010099 [Acer saccharum]|uniref:Uncharacterized protein n=1 Tax=Acer saccharum TaxID=4024 RepID=A0AA39VV31_ACESA|nr:hypothetical protein LWI29_010099 [Acer saccharum]